MALNLTNLFTALGRVGREAYIINSQQDLMDNPYSQLTGFSYVNPTWLTPLTSSAAYDSLIRQQSAAMQAGWTAAATTILQGFVTADNPAFGGSLSSSLMYLRQQMIDQSKTVQSCTITAVVTAAADNVGVPVFIVSTKRGDGLINQNIIAEVGTIVITSDSYSGGVSVGREPWTWVGAPNISSLGTGIGVGIWDWDAFQGSGSTSNSTLISAIDDATAGNLILNGDFELWTPQSTSSTAVLNYWFLSGGAWGTDLQQSTAEVLNGTYSIRFTPGTAATWFISHQFDSEEDDGTQATAGTTATLEPLTEYTFNYWLKTVAAGTVLTGVLTLSLRDGSGNVINDEQGVANSTTVTLSTISNTVWTAKQFTFRTPEVMPSIVRLRIAMTTALTGAQMFMDFGAAGEMVPCYTGGPSLIGFSDPRSPVVATSPVIPDNWQVTMTNDYGGSTFFATFQTLLARIFQTPDFIAPYDPAPNIADTLITNA